jgi:4a-hydroxytetrahydrobiopterin dehydratase
MSRLCVGPPCGVVGLAFFPAAITQATIAVVVTSLITALAFSARGGCRAACARSRGIVVGNGLPVRMSASSAAAKPTPDALGLAHTEGAGETKEELLACKIGGCCGKDTPPLAHEDALKRLESLPLWALSDDAKVISRELTAKNFVAAMAFLNAVGELAEAEGHHPDFHLTGYRNVRIELSTHAIGGLSMPDMVLAAKIDAIPCEYSPKWLRESAAGAIIAADAAKRPRNE